MKVYEVTFIIETDEDPNTNNGNALVAAHANSGELVAVFHKHTTARQVEVWEGQTLVKELTRYSPAYLRRMKEGK